MMMVGVFWAWAGLLAVGGMLKVARPDDTARALRHTAINPGRTGVRLGGAIEVGVATVAIVSGNRVAVALVGVSYLGFAAFVTVALVRRWPLASCGCLGQVDTPPSAGHIVVDLIGAAVALAVVARPIGTFGHVVDSQPLAGLPLVLTAALTAYLAALVMGRLALVDQARRNEVGP